MRERGLKLLRYHNTVELILVAPHAGAWIETFMYTLNWEFRGSLPMRERGLKRSTGAGNEANFGSLPMRERGLKQIIEIFNGLQICRSPCGSVD